MSQAQAVELEWRHEAVESHIASKQKRRQTDLLIMPYLFPMEVILAEEISFLKNDKTMCFQSLKKYPLKMMLHRHCASSGATWSKQRWRRLPSPRLNILMILKMW
jgi:hypothetical protein